MRNQVKVAVKMADPNSVMKNRSFHLMFYKHITSIIMVLIIIVYTSSRILFYFRINEPHFIFGLMNPISFLDQWTPFYFRINETHFIFGLMNPFHFSDQRTRFILRINEPNFIFGLMIPISVSD